MLAAYKIFGISKILAKGKIDGRDTSVCEEADKGENWDNGF